MDAPKAFFVPKEIHDYLVAHGTPPDPVLQSLIAETQRVAGPMAIMQVAPEQGAFMQLLVRAVGARRILEIGTFTGYSALCMARGLPEDGKLLCCDVSEEWTAVARRHWQQAGVAAKIDLRIAPALETLRALPRVPDWDLGFIDADKPAYPDYFEEILARLRPGGLVLVDNVLWMGRVADPEARDDQTEAIRAFNDALAADSRVEVVMLPIADGLTIARKVDA